MIDPAYRASLSEGRSTEPVHQLVRRTLEREVGRAQTLLDVGCGTGGLARSLDGLFERYVGCDIVRYDGLPADLEFRQANLNASPYPIEDRFADVVTCVETIEHLENPRLVMRELLRLAKPGGLVVVTTPNQLSLFSKISLVVKNQFQAFRGREYPAHITALVEEDLVRIANETGLSGATIRFTDEGRMPFTSRHWPASLGFGGRPFSDNVALVCRRPA
jgi:2-polyprenyl-3-methyl-5-hydroxy-6-metoxy-1,4-benzoquinol methylase